VGAIGNSIISRSKKIGRTPDLKEIPRIILLGQLLFWIVEHWALLLAIIGFVIMLQWLKKLVDQLSNILVELRAIGKDTGHMLRVINEEIERNTTEVSAVHSAVSWLDHTLSDSLQVLYRIENELSPPPTPYLTPTGDRL
jgi:hypothetical protein